MDVAPPAAPAPSDDQPLPRGQQLAKDMAFVRVVAARRDACNGSGRDGQQHVSSVLAMRLATGAGATRPGTVMRMVPEVPKGGHAGVDDEHDVATGAAIPAVGATAGNVRLASKR